MTAPRDSESMRVLEAAPTERAKVLGGPGPLREVYAEWVGFSQNDNDMPRDAS